MVQLRNFLFFITSMVMPRGTAAPLLLKWFVSRDVPIGAPFSNGTIIPIIIPSFPLLVYLHSKKFIHSMDGAKIHFFQKVSFVQQNAKAGNKRNIRKEKKNI
uniref:Uncharacterized protein n=1 Tax=Cajanus cajan TaxID=3821 RepID=A0A151T4J4_CAJCA|nr:hypothetical protein KK1_016472 [Cajanus cajan]KYP61959.1 hypothetical protein KK1_016474 [Cajanus cajan]